MNNSSNYRLTVLSILVILAFGTFAPALAYAAPTANDGNSWQNVNGNGWAWNYSPQNQINKDNVKNLEVKWVFPVGAKSSASAAIQAASTSEGVSTPPIVVN